MKKRLPVILLCLALAGLTLWGHLDALAGIAAARAKAPEDIYRWEGAHAPNYLPGGYVYESSLEVRENIHRVTYAVPWKRKTIEFHQYAGALPPDTKNLAETQRLVVMGGGEAILTELPRQTALEWHADGITFRLSGSPPAQELLKMAESVSPVG